MSVLNTGQLASESRQDCAPEAEAAEGNWPASDLPGTTESANTAAASALAASAVRVAANAGPAAPCAKRDCLAT